MTNIAVSTHAPTIQELNGALLIPKPRKKPFRVSRERRERIEAAVDGLLLLLDAIDADPDLEPSTSALTELGVPSGAWDECENNHDAEHEDGEPSLGWTASNKQLGWPWYGDTDEREYEHDGGESSLGAINDSFNAWCGLLNPDQTRWRSTNMDEREDDGDDLEPDGRDLPCDPRDPIDQSILPYGGTP